MSDTPAAGPADAEEHEPTPLEELWWLFKDAGLPFPPLPRELADRLREVEAWIFASKDIEGSPWDIEGFVDEAVEGTGDYVLVAHTGYGLNSWAIHYFVVQGGLAILLQIPWGGTYTDNDAAAARMGELFAEAAELIEFGADALEPGERLVVVESASAGGRVARFPAGTTPGQLAWRPAADPVLTALLALRGSGSALG